MRVTDILGTAQDAITVKRVFGEPYQSDGLTFIPVARVGGAGGGGTGTDEKGQNGEGGGFGLGGRPAGAFVIRGNDVEWRPAVDPNRIVMMVGVVVLAVVLSRPRLVRARALARAAG